MLIGFYLIFYVPAMLAAGVLTSWICSYRANREKRVSFDVVLIAPLITAIAIAIIPQLADSGLTVFTAGYWAEQPGAFAAAVIVFEFMVLACAVPALLVVLYHRKRSNRIDAGSGAEGMTSPHHFRLPHFSNAATSR
jgi:hypothetical protein